MSELTLMWPTSYHNDDELLVLAGRHAELEGAFNIYLKPEKADKLFPQLQVNMERRGRECTRGEPIDHGNGHVWIPVKVSERKAVAV